VSALDETGEVDQQLRRADVGRVEARSEVPSHRGIGVRVRHEARSVTVFSATFTWVSSMENSVEPSGAMKSFTWATAVPAGSCPGSKGGLSSTGWVKVCPWCPSTKPWVSAWPRIPLATGAAAPVMDTCTAELRAPAGIVRLEWS